MVLPRILENLLETATRDSELKSWCIFQENNGDSTFKIKLGAPSSSANRVKPYAYRRKSHSQVMRDEARSKAWRSRQTEVRNVASAPLGNMGRSTVSCCSGSECHHYITRQNGHTAHTTESSTSRTHDKE